MFLSFFDSEDYEMKKSKSSEPRDRLSELPDSLILLILSLLPMRDVVRTTLLSKRWKDLWTTVPCLHFSDDTDDLVSFQNFVTRALLLWKGSRIQKFDIVFYHCQSASSDLDLWLRVAMENEVEELNVNLIDNDDLIPYYEDGEYWAPQRLYSCSSIRKLSLVACNLKIHGNVHWNQLKCLTIDVVSLSEHVINQVLSGTPQLEVLILHLMESHENLNIQSSSLKKLTIEMYKYGMDDDEAKDTVLTIWAPNVETLDISGFLYSEYLLMNVSSLTDATLGFSGPRYQFELRGQKLMQVFQSIRHVEKVTLSDWCIELYQVLGVMKKKDLLSPLSDAKSLKLYCRKVVKIGDLLELFPKLTMLVLEFPNIWAYKGEYIEPVVLKFDEENPLKSKANFPKSVLLHLRTVEITWFARDTSIYPLMEFLLKYASTLEKMVFRPMAIMSVAPESLFSAAQKLLSMPRSSPTAKVLGVFTKKNLLSSPSDARFLKLYGSEVNKVVDLEMFPKLTMLVIELSDLWMYEQDIKGPVVLKFDEKNPLKSKTNFPKSCLLHLRTVEITWIARDTSIYPLIEFLLKYASTLEKLVIRARRITSLAPESFLLASQKLLRMPRSSPIAEVILCEK